MRTLTASEMQLVSGGLTSSPLDDFYQSMQELADWLRSLINDPSEYSNSDGNNDDEEIVVTGTRPEGLDIGNGNELLWYPDGIVALYSNGSYVTNVTDVVLTSTNGSPDVSVNIGYNSAGFSFNAHDQNGATYTPTGRDPSPDTEQP